jgi:hypothetical protein
MGTVAASLAHDFLPAEATLPSDRQRLFLLFFTGTLIDLVVLGLFAEYSDKVYVDSFTTTLLAAIALQVLLKATIWCEHRVLARFKGKAGAAWTAAKFFVAWLILFGSKFVILEALSLLFEKDLHFEGIWHGIIWLIIVVVTMLLVEQVVARLYRRLA